LVLTRFSRKEKTKEGEEDAQGVTMLLAAMAVMATIILALLMLASAALLLEVILRPTGPVRASDWSNASSRQR
jgi:hypothetical protein